MKKMTVLYGIFLAAAFAIAAPIAYTGLRCFFAPGLALRALIAAGVVAYAVALVPRSPRRSGRLFALSAVAVGQAIVLLADFPLSGFVFFSTALVWLARSSLLAKSCLHAATEAMLVAMALFCAIFALGSIGSLGLAVWSAMLLLAAGPLLAAVHGPSQPGEMRMMDPDSPRFERAFAVAEQAIAQMARSREA